MAEEFDIKTPRETAGGPKTKKTKNKLYVTLSVIVGVLIVLTLSFLLWQLNEKQSKVSQNKQDEKTQKVQEEKAVVETNLPTNKEIYVNVEEGLRLRKKPIANGTVLATMIYGTKLSVLEQNTDWYRVEYQGNSGWCMREYTSVEKPKEASVRDVDFSKIIPFDSSIASLGNSVYGDFNSDGRDEALVTVIYDGSGSYKNFYVYGYKDGYVLTKYLEVTKKALANAYVEGNQGHEKMEYNAGKLTLSYPLYKKEDPNCCPSGGTEYVYFRWDGKGFVIENLEKK